ncbi:MAG: hypothetical protein MST00_03615 [Tenericutes bacterium]|nr:hypothetical protein [Mycoplasmatota bacterium]
MNNSKIESLLNDINIDQYKTQKINDYITLTNYQIEVLKRFDIDPSLYTKLKDIIYVAEEIYEETLDEDLNIVLDELSERNYYENTNK